MPALKTTQFRGEIVWLGRVADSEADLRAAPMDALELKLGGAVGEHHGGITRPSCSRVLALHPRGTEIANTRQLSVVAAEDLAAIAAAIGLEALDPAMLGASMVLRGLPDLSHLPPSSRLQADSGATLVVDMENRPCVLPGKVIEAAHPGAGRTFKAAAAGRRGVTAWVERSGAVKLGDMLRLFIPDQPVWHHLEAARAP